MIYALVIRNCILLVVKCLNDFTKENDMLVSMDASIYKGNSGEIFLKFQHLENIFLTSVTDIFLTWFSK